MAKTDLTGNRFGRLTVVADSGERPGRRVLWDCVCDCGKSTRVTTDSLRSGHTRSCGCLSRREIEVGQRFGQLTVVARSPRREGTKSVWVCRCDCGADTEVRAGSLTSGNTRSCGCLRRERAELAPQADD